MLPASFHEIIPVLQTAIDKNFSSVATSLAAYGTAFDTLTTSMNATDGMITSRTDGLTATSKLFATRIDEMNRQLTLVEARYRKQYTALDTIMGKLQTTSSYLTQFISSKSSS